MRVHQNNDMFSDSVRGRRESVLAHKRASASARARGRLIDRERKRLCSYMYEYVYVGISRKPRKLCTFI